MHNQIIGKRGELMVENYLVEKGYSILQTNYLKRLGEIDLITFDPIKKEIVFVEVKTRTNRNFGYPEEAVTSRKLIKMERAALSWLKENGKIDEAWRMDIISVEMGKSPQIIHLENVTL